MLGRGTSRLLGCLPYPGSNPTPLSMPAQLSGGGGIFDAATIATAVGGLGSVALLAYLGLQL